MKKIVSLLLTIVLMASMFAMLGTVTASAERVQSVKTLVNLTFDGDARYGFVAGRYAGLKYENGYARLHNGVGNNGASYIGLNGTLGETLVPHTAGAAEKEAAYNNLIKLEAGKTYRLSFDYQFLAGTGCTPGTFREMTIAVNTNPLNAADSERDLSTRTTIIESKPATLPFAAGEADVLTEDAEWGSAYYVFTVREKDTAGLCIGLGSGYDVKYESKVYVDNVKIEEVLSSYAYNETGVYTMDNNEMVNMSATTVTFEDDAEKGKVAKVVGGNGGRAYIPNTPITNKNTKYFITFDAKGIAEGNFINLGFGCIKEPVRCRIFFMGYNDTARGARLYINGVETTIKEGFTNVTTEWQSYGIVIDTSNADFIEATNVVGQGVLAEATYVFLGAQESTVYFDNVKIVEVGAVPTVVPEKDESAKYSIRETAAGTTAGLRFRGSVANTVKATADEIGFVVAPVKLVSGDADWYKLDSLNAAAKKAVAFDGTKDVVYSSDADTTSYQLILTKLDNILVQRFAAVMYVKTGDTYDYISLGEISYNQVIAEYAVRGK